MIEQGGEKMGKRKDLKNKIFGDIFVLEFYKQKNTHAHWKCLCMRCNKLVYVSASNLESGNTKSCTSCGQKTTNYVQDINIADRIKNGEKIARIARDMNVSRGVVYRIKRDEVRKK